jgi:two-component system phosphate regulon sensor histidine kinase PhoR
MIIGTSAALAVVIFADPSRWVMIGLIAMAAGMCLWVVWRGNTKTHASIAAVRSATHDLAQLANLETPQELELDRLAEVISQAAGAWNVRLITTTVERDELDAILRATEHPLLVTDDEGTVVLTNDAAGTFLGSRVATLVGRTIDEVITWTEVLRLHAAAREGKECKGQFRLMRSGSNGGSSIVDVWARPLSVPSTSADRCLVLLMMHDVGEAARALQIRTDFVANASHELRTPIAAMRVAIDTLDAIGDDDPVARKRFMGIVAGNIDRLEELIRDLLDLSRLESTDVTLEIASVNTSELADSLHLAFERVRTERKLNVSWEISPSLATVRTDRRLLLLILRNLLENALNFSYEGTTVRVIARPSEGRTRGVTWEVIDQGIGIPLEQQQRIFERFYQVNPARTGAGSTRRGTGLGLSIVRHAVKTLGGTIRVESVWKEGTRMIVDLPTPTEGSTP